MRRRLIMFNSKFIALALVLALASTVFSAWGAKIYPDEFDGPKIHSSWKWQKEPKTWDAGKTNRGWLHFEGTFGGNLWCTDDATKLYQEIEDEPFDIETHLFCEWGNNDSDIAGITAKSPDADNWVKLKFWMHLNKTAQIQFQKKCTESGDGLIGNVPGFSPSGGKAEVWFRLKRDGNKCTAFYKTTEKEDWKEIGTTSFPFKAPYQAGIYAGVDSGSGKLIVEFDYFKDNLSPFALAVSPTDKLASTWGGMKASY
jgi:hypothetical protein